MTLPDPRHRRLALLRRLRAQVAAEIHRLDLALAVERARLEGRPVLLESGHTVPPCGTEKAYQWHRHLASKLRGYRHDCEVCLAAHTRHNRGLEPTVCGGSIDCAWGCPGCPDHSAALVAGTTTNTAGGTT